MWLAVRDATIAVATGSQRRQTRGKWGAEMRIGIVALLSVLSLSLARAYVLACFFHWHRHVGGSTNESPHLNM